MPDGFVSLVQHLRGTYAAAESAADDAETLRNNVPQHECEFEDDSSRTYTPVVHDALRVRAAIADAFEVVRDDLLRDLACDVLGRELQLAPCDIAGIVERALTSCRAEFPIAVRVHPDDVAALQNCAVAVVCDTNLRRGDVLLDLHKGTIDVTLGARVAEVLAAYSQS